MDRIYITAEEDKVANTILYFKGDYNSEGDEYIYSSEKCDEESKISKDDLIDLCLKGVVCKDLNNGSIRFPMCAYDMGDHSYVRLTDNDGRAWNKHSKEYVKTK